MRRVNAFAGLLALIAAVAVGSAIARSWSQFDGNMVAFGAALTITLAVPVRFRHRGVGHHLTLDEAMILPAIALLPMDEVIVAAAVAHLFANLARGPHLVRTVFNVGSQVVAILLVKVAWDLAEPGGLFAQVFVGAVTNQTVTMLALGLVMYWREGRSLQTSTRQLAPALIVATWAGVVIGVGLIIFGRTNFAIVPLSVVPIVLVIAGARAALALELQRRRADRMRAVSSSLTRVQVVPDDLRPPLEAVAELFDASGAVVVLGDGRTARVGLRVDGVVAEFGDLREPFVDEGRVLAVPLVDEMGRAEGMIAVVDRSMLEPWDRTDIALLQSIADELMVSIARSDLLVQIEVERAGLAARTQLLDDLLAAANDGILLLDEDGRVRMWNPALQALTGRAADDAIGRHWWDVLALLDTTGRPVDRTNPAGLATLSPTVETWQLGLEHPRWVRASCAPLRDGGTAVVLHDITRVREVERMKSDFVATVSHELRTPLTPLRGVVQTLLKHGGQLDDDQREALLNAQARQVDRLEALVGDLLMVAEMGAEATRTGDVMPIDMPATVRHVVGRVEPGGGRVRVVTPSRCTPALGTPAAVERIIRELLDNALVHGRGAITVTVLDRGDEVLMEVHDEGPGIPPSEREAVFDQFHRLGDHLHRPQGPGLGLTVVRSLARQDAGDVVLAATSEGGSTFRFTLPSVRTRLVRLGIKPGPAGRGQQLLADSLFGELPAEVLSVRSDS